MKSPRIILSFCFSASLLLTSCAGKFSQAQRDALSTAAITGTTVDAGAYEDPYGGDLQMRNNAANIPATGILGPLIGLGIGSAVAGTQNATFKGKNSGYFSAVRKNTPQDLDKTLNGTLRQQLKNDSFFRTRITGTSSNLFTSNIVSYRLIRSGKNSDGTLTFVPEIQADIHLKDSKGKNLQGRTYTAVGNGAHPVGDYATNPALTKQAYDSAVHNAVNQFMRELRLRTAE